MSKKSNRKNNSFSLPEKFLERLPLIVGQSFFSEIKKTFVERPTTFRINTLKAKREEILYFLRENNFQVKNILWYKDAFILQNKTKRELMELPIYTEGKIYLQSLASMIPPLVLCPLPGEKILDLTAAPGSKTSQIASLMEKTGELVANDNNKIRFFKLKHNMENLNVVNVEDVVNVVNVVDDANVLSDWKFVLRMENGPKLCSEFPNYFDKILLDAPCSAEARFIIGNPKTFGYWSEKKVKEMADKQYHLLLSAWYALRPGGILVYSTCTMSPEENEAQIAKLIRRFPEEAKILPIDLEIKKLSTVLKWKEKEFPKEIKNTLRVMPTMEIEGFFVAKIEKLCKEECDDKMIR